MVDLVREKSDKEFLGDLEKLISGECSEYPPLFSEIPKNYQKDFKSWCAEYKQQTWDGMWERGWEIYNREYVHFLIINKLKENKKEN